MGERRRAGFEGELTLRRINRRMLGLSLAPAVLGVSLYVAGLPGLATLSPALFVLSAVAVGWVLGRRPAPVREERPVRIEPDVLRIGDVAIARARIRDAQLVPTPGGGFFVRVSRRAELPVDLDVRDRSEGRSVLRALGFDASQAVARFAGSSRLLAFLGARAGLAFVAFPALFLALGFLLESSPVLWANGIKALGVLFFAAATALLVPARIDVGADGVLVRWLGTTRFLPLTKIRTVERSFAGFGFGDDRQVGARIRTVDGEDVWLPVGKARWASERAGALVERIHEAMETHARGSVDASAALLGRRERDVRAWIQELRAIGAGANADLRTAPVSPEHLWRIVESHGAPPADRAAAAVALGASLDDGGKQRLRVAVDAIADERLRVAIGAAVGEDEESLAEALAEVTAPSASDGSG